MELKRAEKLLTKFNEGRILVVGDVILDDFLYGDAERISPEAPVPVVDIKRQNTQLGGAANVVNNLCALGAKAALCGVIGNDDGGNRILKLLHGLNVPTDGTVVEIGRDTAVKTRVVAANQQVVRFDREDKSPLSNAARKKLQDFIRRAQKNFNAIIISDYGKGVISADLVEVILKTAKTQGMPVLVDPKPENFGLYVGATVVTPNLKEAGVALGRKLDTAEKVEAGGKEIIEKFKPEMALITRGEQGMSLFRAGTKPHHVPTRARQVYDVTGAGDTVIATFTLALTAGADPVEAAEISNQAAGVVVGKLGTATVSQSEIRTSIARFAQEVKEGLPA
jgi:D-beta-D-heptose 7-phosphate kinase/D-beta-D-heptose 1-phosphate adenosyltransferase